MAKYIEKAMSISIFKSKQCKLAPTVTALGTDNFAYTNVRAKLFYVHENSSIQILNLSSPEMSLTLLEALRYNTLCLTYK